MSKQRDDIKPIPYAMLWDHMASIVTEREITLKALIENIDCPLTSTHRKELENRIKMATLICQLIDLCASITDEIDDARRRKRRVTVKAHEEANA